MSAFHLCSRHRNAPASANLSESRRSHFHSHEPLDIPASQLYSKPFSHALAVVEEQQWCRTQR